MKGLLVKDFRLMKGQKNFLVLLFIMIAFVFISGMDASFFMGYLPFLLMIAAMSTITYDEFDRGYSFLFTLPVSRRGYVKEKYVFGLLFCGGIWILSVLISLIYVWITKEIPIDDALMVNYAVSIILVLVFMGISIPVQLKYGNEKGRLAVVAIGVGGFAVIVGGIQLGKVFDIEMTAALQRVEKMGAGTVSVIGCIVSVILIVISYKISVRIMEKKEF